LLQEREVRRLRLERDDDASAPRHHVGAVVPLVSAEIEDDGARVVGGIRVVRDGPLERLPVDRVVRVREEHDPGPVAEGICGPWPEPAADLGVQQAKARAERKPTPEEHAR